MHHQPSVSQAPPGPASGAHNAAVNKLDLGRRPRDMEEPQKNGGEMEQEGKGEIGGERDKVPSGISFFPTSSSAIA